LTLGNLFKKKTKDKAQMPEKKKGDTWRYFKRHKYTYFLLIPGMLATLIFNYLPILGISIAFKQYNVLDGIMGSPWVGIDNFIEVFSMPSMWLAIKNTFVYGLCILFGNTPFVILFALLLNEVRNATYKKIVQTVSYLPHFLSWASVGAIFYGFFSLSGPFNDIMSSLIDSWEPTNILMDSKYFIHIIYGTNLWKGLGWSAVIYLAAIAGVDQSLYEAAAIDGCGKFRQAIKITIPLIAPTIVIQFIMSIGVLITSNFEQVYAFQNIYTQDATETVNTLSFRMGIGQGNYSEAAAYGIAHGVIALILTMSTNWLSKKITGMSVW
jgi:putative aldouronate transport system permease protein